MPDGLSDAAAAYLESIRFVLVDSVLTRTVPPEHHVALPPEVYDAFVEWGRQYGSLLSDEPDLDSSHDWSSASNHVSQSPTIERVMAHLSGVPFSLDGFALFAGLAMEALVFDQDDPASFSAAVLADTDQVLAPFAPPVDDPSSPVSSAAESSSTPAAVLLGLSLRLHVACQRSRTRLEPSEISARFAITMGVCCAVMFPA